MVEQRLKVHHYSQQECKDNRRAKNRGDFAVEPYRGRLPSIRSDAPRLRAISVRRILSMPSVVHRKARVLFVCSMNRWRSPTAEAIWRRSREVDVRSRGLSPKARQRLIADDLAWADLVLVMTHEQSARLRQRFPEVVSDGSVVVLDIPDDYKYMGPDLIELLHDRAGPEIERVLKAGNVSTD